VSFCVHQTRPKSRNITQHSAICYAHNQHLPSLSWFSWQLGMSTMVALLLQAWNEKWKPMDNNTWISYCLKNVSRYQTHCSRNFIFIGKNDIIPLCMQHSPTAAAKLLIHVDPELCPSPPLIQRWIPLVTTYKILRFIGYCSMNISCESTRLKKKQKILTAVSESSNTAFE